MAHMLNKGDYLSVLLRTGQSVFSTKEIALLWGEATGAAFRKRLSSYHVKSGKLYAIRQGIYATDKEYDRMELATKIYCPAYISFETVLGKAGVVFQAYKKIFVASYQTREIKVQGQVYAFRKIRNEILLNPAGLTHDNKYSIASPERAFLDTLYLNKNYHFDNLSTLDQKKIMEILPIYRNKRMQKNVEKLFPNLNVKQ